MEVLIKRSAGVSNNTLPAHKKLYNLFKKGRRALGRACSRAVAITLVISLLKSRNIYLRGMGSLLLLDGVSVNRKIANDHQPDQSVNTESFQKRYAKEYYL